MERPKGRRRRIMRTQYLCLPLLKSTTTAAADAPISTSTSTITAADSNPSSRFSPATSLLERFREAVFRLVMLTALSKATNHDRPHSPAGSPNDRIRKSYNHSPHDPHQSEAVADCIEFFKKSSSSVGDLHPRDSTATTVDSTAASEAVFSVPIV
ncbi:hypothetical protein Ancab_040143 [Ancistrocladus abbreviatus]